MKKLVKMNRLIWFALISAFSFANSECPCTTEPQDIFGNLALSCSPQTIHDFPDDITSACGDLPYNKIVTIELFDQAIRRIKSKAFVSFPKLNQVALSNNDITEVADDAFEGVTEIAGKKGMSYMCDCIVKGMS